MSVKSRSFEARERRKCRAKQKYPSPEAAAIKLGHNVCNNTNLKPYKCPWCDLWHVSSMKNTRYQQPSGQEARV